MYRIGQVAAQLDISPSTLRRWSERFAEWLSEQVTNPQKLEDGRYAPITYDDNDLEVLQTIQDLTQEGASYEEIEAHLSKSEEGEHDKDSTLALRGQETPDLFMKRTAAAALGQALHQLSDRKQNPFLTINCAALPEQLLESELFGYESGAFTGASKGGKPGLFELAQGGTIFLDEIAEMSNYLQAKLLRFLQDSKYQVEGER